MKFILSALVILSISLSSCAQKRPAKESSSELQNKQQQTSVPSHKVTSSDSGKNPGSTSSRDTSEKSVSSSMEIAKRFIRDLANPDIALDVILSKHVLTSDADDEIYDYMLASLAEIRLNLMSKRLEDIRFIPYAERSRRDVADIDPEGKNTNNMIFLEYGKRQLTALYIEQSKIASFTLVSKGNHMAHFVTY